MPVGNYPTFEACVSAQIKKGKSKDSAGAICGQIEKNTQEGLKRQGESIRYDDDNGHLFIKAFLLDASTNINKWGVNPSSFDDKINTFIGKPLVLTENFRHPMPPESNRVGSHNLYDNDDNPYNTVNAREILDHWLQYQELFRVGTIVDITEKKGTYYAIIEVTDAAAKESFRNNDLPLFVSPAIAQLDPFEDASNITNWTGVHLAIVANPAYTIQKAIISGQCHGESERCLMQLRQAAVIKMASAETPNISSCGFCRWNALARYAEIVKSWKTHHNVVITKDPRDLVANSSFHTSKTQYKSELTESENNNQNNNNKQSDQQNNGNNTTVDTNKPQDFEKTQNEQGGDLSQTSQKGNPKDNEVKKEAETFSKRVEDIGILVAGMNECIQIFQQNGIQDPQQATQICKLAAQAFEQQNPNTPQGGQQQGAPQSPQKFGSVTESEKEIARLETRVADLTNELKNYKKSDKTDAQRIAELEETVTSLNRQYKEKELEAYLVTKIADEDLRNKKIKRFAELGLALDDVKDIYPENNTPAKQAVKRTAEVEGTSSLQQNEYLLKPNSKVALKVASADDSESNGKSANSNPIADRNSRIISSLTSRN